MNSIQSFQPVEQYNYNHSHNNNHVKLFSKHQSEFSVNKHLADNRNTKINYDNNHINNNKNYSNKEKMKIYYKDKRKNYLPLSTDISTTIPRSIISNKANNYKL